MKIFINPLHCKNHAAGSFRIISNDIMLRIIWLSVSFHNNFNSGATGVRNYSNKSPEGISNFSTFPEELFWRGGGEEGRRGEGLEKNLKLLRRRLKCFSMHLI